MAGTTSSTSKATTSSKTTAKQWYFEKLATPEDVTRFLRKENIQPGNVTILHVDGNYILFHYE